MIPLTRLNQARFYLNPDLIKEMEANPDTVLTLTTREKIVVLEPLSTIAHEIVQFRRQIQTLDASSAVAAKEE
jgi:flagellar protein FlbD